MTTVLSHHRPALVAQLLLLAVLWGFASHATAGSFIGASEISTLTLGTSGGTANSLVELGNEGLIITNVSGSVYYEPSGGTGTVTLTGSGAIIQAIQDGYGSGNWLGPYGITAFDGIYDPSNGPWAIGWALDVNGSLSGNWTNDTWGGVTVPTTGNVMLLLECNPSHEAAWDPPPLTGFTILTATVPEPSTLALLGAALLGLGVVCRRRPARD